jgi:hypothetical protein
MVVWKCSQPHDEESSSSCGSWAKASVLSGVLADASPPLHRLSNTSGTIVKRFTDILIFYYIVVYFTGIFVQQTC